MQTLNHRRQSLLLNPDSKIGVINERGDLSQLQTILSSPNMCGSYRYYTIMLATDIPEAGIIYQPISYFYEPDTIITDEVELPKVDRKPSAYNTPYGVVYPCQLKPIYCTEFKMENGKRITHSPHRFRH